MAEPVPLTSSARYDWIENFFNLTECIPSPPIFRLWCGIATVAGALERRVWVVSAGKRVFPNLYTLLVGHPGTGKTQAIEHVSYLWYSCRALFISPQHVTNP